MRIKLLFLVVCGFFFLLLALIGLFLPVWPTTPFVLCAAGCFARTPKLHAWLIKAPLFRDYIKNYQSRRGLPKKTVAISLVFLWAMLGGSIFLVEHLWLKLLLGCIGLAVMTHILYMSKPRPPCEVKPNE